MEEGWLCPRCKKVNAPWVPFCSCTTDYADRLTQDWWVSVTQNTDTPPIVQGCTITAN